MTVCSIKFYPADFNALLLFEICGKLPFSLILLISHISTLLRYNTIFLNAFENNKPPFKGKTNEIA